MLICWLNAECIEDEALTIQQSARSPNAECL